MSRHSGLLAARGWGWRGDEQAPAGGAPTLTVPVDLGPAVQIASACYRFRGVVGHRAYASLVQDITTGVKAQYGALVFDDPVLVRLAGPSGPPSNDTGRSRVGSPELQALLAAALPSALAGALPQDTLRAAFGGASGQAAVLSFLLSKEATVLRRMQARLRDHLPIHLMHNASSQHALPSLLSGSFTDRLCSPMRVLREAAYAAWKTRVPHAEIAASERLLVPGLHETVGALNSAPGSTRPRFTAHSHPLPLSLEESVELDSVLMVLTALFVLVPFCLLSGES